MIIAGDGGSTINGDLGNDTLVGGKGKDFFIYEEDSGNKLIKNYESGKDVISLESGVKINSMEDDGENLILTVGNNEITIEGGAGKEFTFDDGVSINNTTEKIAKDGMLISRNASTRNEFVSVTSGFSSSTIDFSENGDEGRENYLNLDASERKRGLTITGNTEANSIIGSKGSDVIYGGDGEDIIRGGKGNDTLWGGDNEDTFIFNTGDGTDTIKDFEVSVDKLLIYDKRDKPVNFKGKYNSKNGGTLTLTVTGGGKIILENVGTNLTDADTFNINGIDHHISGKKLK